MCQPKHGRRSAQRRAAPHQRTNDPAAGKRSDLMYSRIVATGGYLPEKTLTNRDLEQVVDTSDDWIVARTGIRERHIAAEHEATSDLACQASREAIAAAGISPSPIYLIIVATTTPDLIFPSTACILQEKLGIGNGCPAFDIQAVCSGFVYALATADQFVRSGQSKCALVVGAETFSRLLDWTDRGTCVLFGDGAGAVILAASEAPGIISTHLHADGSYRQLLAVPGGVSGGKLRSDAGAEQCLVGVDVAHADHHAAVHDELFDGDAAAACGLVEIARVEILFQRFGA